ncbi:MAG: NAD(P)/FAD-dependent oxidoreductase [Bradymonadales bacterium]
MVKQAVIIGAGPAGISAALYLARAGVDTTIVYRDAGALGKTELVGNYYGFADPITGPDLFEIGKKQAENLGAKLVQAEAMGITFGEKMELVSSLGNFPADAIILATGSQRRRPRISGIAELEGRGVSYCAVCDAYFYRGKTVGVLGSGNYAVHEASELLPLAGKVTLYTQGEEPPPNLPENLALDRRKIVNIKGDKSLESIDFEDGSSESLDGLFIAQGVAGTAELALKAGAEIDNNRIVVNEKMETTLEGLYAAGDCIGGMLQIAKAVHNGAQAAMSAIQYLRKLKS